MILVAYWAGFVPDSFLKVDYVRQIFDEAQYEFCEDLFVAGALIDIFNS